MTDLPKDKSTQPSGPGVVFSTKPGQRGADVSVWGGTLNPFQSCSRYGGCGDLAEVARALPLPPAPENKPSLDKQAADVEKMLTESFLGQNLKSKEMNDLLDKVGVKGDKITSRDLQGAVQAKANTAIDEFGKSLKEAHLAEGNISTLKNNFDGYADTSRLIANLDRLGVQGSDLSYSRLNTHAGAFAQDMLQVGLQYREALVTSLRKPGGDVEKDRQELKKLTETLGKLYPDRKQEFDTYQDQVLKSLIKPAPTGPASSGPSQG